MAKKMWISSWHIRKRIWMLAGCLCGSILIVLLLYVLSGNINHRYNGFIRMVPPSPLNAGEFLDIGYNSYYIAGVTPQQIYLGNATAPTHLLAVDYALSDTQQLRLHIKSEKYLPGAIVKIDSPHVYMVDGNARAILYGTLPGGILDIRSDSLHFSGAVPVSAASYALRTYDTSLQQNILVKQRLDSPCFRPAPGVLEKQVDGLFCTDGTLQYDPATARLVYVYFYRNQFVCLDTNLNVLYRGRTIDTVSHANIKVASIASHNKITLTTPAATINKLSCMNGEWLFINSNLPANNENRRLFKGCSVIDVYALKDGRYAFSFYIPDYYGKKISNFCVFNKNLIAIHDRYLAVYQLNIKS